LRWLGLGVAGTVALVALVLAVSLVAVRASHAERIFPGVTVADVPIGGLAFDEAGAALAARAAAVEASTVTFRRGDAAWTATLAEIGVAVDPADAVNHAAEVGREGSALRRLLAITESASGGRHVALPISLDFKRLDQWFDSIDRDLGSPPRNASIVVEGANISIVPEVDGIVVDREQARAAIVEQLLNLRPIDADLPVVTKIATVRVVDLEPARAMLLRAMSHPVQVTNGSGLWTLPATDLAQFLRQEVKPGPDGAPLIELGLDRSRLATWLDERLGEEIDTEPVDAEVGWNGERLVSVVPSVDGVRLDAAKLAEQVEGRFFGDGGTVKAPVSYVKPTIDSANLDALGITTLLATGSSNYSGSSDGRAHNVAVGAKLMSGTLIPPWGEFSFNEAIGLIDEEKGFVEAQVIAGEKIGKDIGGGICQVSTTVFRAAYLAGLPITEWWPHRFRIGFYEYDGWKPGLDASILQPTDDPATWADFKFENPSDSWMLVESWTDGVNVVVNLYGADLGYTVETTGPTWGEKFQMLPPQEVVDPELDPGTVTQAQTGGIGEELSHYRVVRDRNGELLWERSFYTKYFPRGEIWKVSPDMKGQAPLDESFKFPPLPPAGIDSMGWEPTPEELAAAAAAAPVWTPPAEEAGPAEEWAPPAEEWAPPAEEWAPPAEEWTPPVEDAVTG
jgi:vancomycin resistance protein YoaR